MEDVSDFLCFMDFNAMYRCKILEILGLLHWNSKVFPPFFWGLAEGSAWVPGSKTLECIELMRENGEKCQVAPVAPVADG